MPNKPGDHQTQAAQSQPTTGDQLILDELRQSVRLLQATLNANPEHTCVLNEQGEIVVINNAWRRFAEANPNVSSNVMEGANYLTVCDAANSSDAPEASRFAAGIRAVMQGEIVQFEMEHACHSPTEQRWFIGKVIRLNVPGPIYVVVTHENITKRKLIEEDLRRAEQKYHAIFENALEGIFQSTPGGRFIMVNPAMAGIFGYASPDEMIAAVGSDIGTKIYADAQQRANFIRDMNWFGAIKEFVVQNIRKDGQAIWTKTNARIIRDENGDALYYEGFLEEITERKRITDAEREQRALSEALRDIAAALNSTLKYDDVLDRILENVGRVVRYDVVYMMLIDITTQTARVVRQHDTRATEYTDLTHLQFAIAQTSNLKEMQSTGAPVMVADTRSSPGWVVTPGTSWIRSNLSVPIKIKGGTIGFLGLDSAIPHAFSEKDVDHLRIFADQASLAIENAELYENVQKLAITDPLTGVFNRRGLFQLGEREVERAQRFDRPLAAIFLDIDHFKRVNDTYGHATGDSVLGALIACCRAHVRSVDVLARYGGEEFVLLLTETDLPNALQVAERIRQTVEAMQTPAEPNEHATHRMVQVTVSQGVVQFKPEMRDLATLIERADQAMYAAKTGGRNRVVVEGEIAG
jgi:diguanylate cyclase (GGDEF)-like protein/PAS domain S-box-containing protein